MKTNGGFLVTKIKQLGDRIFEKILSEKNIDAIYKPCWRRTVCQNRLRTASPQGIDAQAAQGGVATLTGRSDETFLVEQFSSADRE